MSDLVVLAKIFICLVLVVLAVGFGEVLIDSVNNGIYKIIFFLLTLILLSNLVSRIIVIFVESRVNND